MVGLVGAVLALAAGFQALLTYHSQMAQVGELMQAQAGLAADRTRHYMSGIVSGVTPLLDFDQPGIGAEPAAIRSEAHRILRRYESILQLRFTDGDRCRGMIVSRLAPDLDLDCTRDPVEASQHLPSKETFERLRGLGVAFGEVAYPDDSEPQLTVSLASRGKTTGLVEAIVDLKRIHETIRDIRFGETGAAFVVDDRERVIAHRDLPLALKRVQFEDLPKRAVVMQRKAVGQPDWHVYVEQESWEAMRPVYASLLAALAVLAVAAAIAIVASFVLARRLTRPILAVRQGAARIGAGDLEARIAVDTGDEIGLLADDFNQMAARLRELYSTLEQRVVDRTAELAQRRLEADNANAAKTRFLAAASHDVRQPMHAVSLLVGLLQERVREPDSKVLVEKIQGSVQAMETLFSSLLDISKLDAGAITPNLSAFELDPLLRRACSPSLPWAQSKGLELRIVRTRAVVLSDALLVERILSNLVTNAVRYTERGRILVGCRRRGSTLAVLVIDTGVGIGHAHLGQVFDEFYQVPGTERDRSQGLGLGLSIVRRTADLLGHPIVVRSRPGHGSTFGIVLPVAPEAKMRVAEPPTEHPHALDGAFVVVVDDDPESRIPMDLLLKQWGCHVVSAESPDRAIEALRGHLRTPDLIVSDYRLGNGETGLDAIARIRAMAEEDIPALLVTGDVATSEPEGRGITVLHKPVAPARLLAAAGRLLTRDVVQ